jgi:hypothetical protein
MTNENKNLTSNCTDVYLVGLGVSPVCHITLQAQDVLQRCTTIFVVDHGFGILKYLGTLCSDVVNLLDEYQEGIHRLTTYQRMASRVIDRALDSSPVAFATYGHPSWLVYPSALIRESGRMLGLNINIVHGISTIDTVIGDLGIDPGTDGLQIHEATGLVKEERQLDPHVPCLLLQADAFDTPIFSMGNRDPERYVALKNYLLKFYDSTHEVISIYSSTHPLMRPIKKRFIIQDLPDTLANQIISGTLFIAPIK